MWTKLFHRGKIFGKELEKKKNFDKIFAMNIETALSHIRGKYKEQFCVFYEFLLSENKKYNLTAITDKKDVFLKHFLDSLMGETFLEINAKVLEVGSGAGFPSVPLKIIRKDLCFSLVESNEKKCLFLKSLVDKLSLNCVQVHCARCEDLVHVDNFREMYDAVLARAVAPLNTLCEYCLPFLRLGGVFLAYKGKDALFELEAASNALYVLGGQVKEIYPYALPKDQGVRNIIVIEKINPTPLKYPRGQGRERKRPL